MKFTTLENTAFPTIMETFYTSFENYFVTFPRNNPGFKQRFADAKTDFRYSIGVFDGDRLVAFILHAVDTRKGLKTAFNIGTGVLPEYRGQALVKRMYEFSFPMLKDAGVEFLQLEVIVENESAIKAYQKVGFDIHRKLFCFKGSLSPGKIPEGCELRALSFDELPAQYPDEKYSWEHQFGSIANDSHIAYQLIRDGKPESYFAIHKSNGGLRQFEFPQDVIGAGQRLFNAISSVSRDIKINNVPESEVAKLALLDHLGLENHINQYEMTMRLPA